MSEAEHTTYQDTGDHDTGHDEAGHDVQLDDHARFGSGIATIYRALDRLVALRHLDDAALVVDVAPLGRQVLRAGRRPLRDDETGLLTRGPGLYVEPAVSAEEPTDDPLGDDPLLGELMVALAELGLRHDVARLAHERGAA